MSDSRLEIEPIMISVGLFVIFILSIIDGFKFIYSLIGVVFAVLSGIFLWGVTKLRQ